MFEYTKKSRFPSKLGPTLKDLLIHNDYAKLSLIRWEMTYKIGLWHISDWN